MKKRVLLLVSLLNLLTAAAFAQTWCPPGAAWTYSYGWFAAYGDVRIAYVGDTLIAGQQCQKLTKTLVTKYRLNPSLPAHTEHLRPEFTYSDADRVYVRANQQFYKLYDFAARPGDSWTTVPGTLNGWCPITVRIVVDSVGQQFFQGRVRRWFRARTESVGSPIFGPAVSFRSRVYEGIGPIRDYLFSQVNSAQCGGTDPEHAGGLLCFSAAGQPTFYGASGSACSMLILANARQRTAQLELEVFPNPSGGQLELRLPAAVRQAEVLVSDHTGRCVLRSAWPAAHSLDVQRLPAGIYNLTVRQNGRLLGARRFVRQ